MQGFFSSCLVSFLEYLPIIAENKKVGKYLVFWCKKMWHKVYCNTDFFDVKIKRSRTHNDEFGLFYIIGMISLTCAPLLLFSKCIVPLWIFMTRLTKDKPSP